MTTPPPPPSNGAAAKGNGGSQGAVGLKESGNKAFAKGDLGEAHRLYSAALEQCGGATSTETTNLRVTVLTNRAMVLFKQGKAEACVADCTSALEADPGRVKAYFRRALAREQLGEDGDALRDAKRALELEPGNKEAVRAARRIKDKVAKAAKLNTPFRQALKALREAADKVQVPSPESALTKATATAIPAQDTEQSQVMLALGALLSSEPAAAVQLLREGGMVPLSACIKAGRAFPKTSREALRALGAAAQHRAFGLVLLKTQGTEVLSELADILAGVEAESVDTTAAVDSRVGGGPEVAIAALTAAVHLLQWDQHVVTDGLSELKDVDRASVYEAGKDLAGAAVSVLAQGLTLPYREVFDAALEAAVRWCAAGADDKHDSKDDAGLPPKEAYEKRQKLHRQRVRASLWLRDKALALLSSSACLVSLYKALSSEEPMERRKASACLSRIGRAVTAVQASEKEREADSNVIKGAVKPLLRFRPDAGGAVVDDSTAEGDVLAAISSESRMQGAVRRVTTAAALANAEGPLGAWAMSLHGFLAEAMTLAASGDEVAQEAAAECFCSAASFDGGRALLGPVVESGVIFALMESKNQAARSAAASAYAKLGMISSALSSDSDDVTKLLNVSLDLITASTTPSAPINKTKDVQSGPGAKTSSPAVSKAAARMDGLKGGAAIADSERAVEVLSFLVSKTKVKEELCYGSARCPKALSRLCRAAENTSGTSPIAYGLAFLFSSLCVSKEEEMKESFKGKDMTYEQYEQLKQLNDSHGQGPKEDETDIKDTVDAAKRRSHALAEAGCVVSLRKIAEDASPATRERVALCFRRLATEPMNRGLIVQQGGLALLINMASVPKASKNKDKDGKEQLDEEQGKGCRLEARHAIAKTLVTTNPNLLTEAQNMGSVPALIAMCRDHESLNLQQFEGLLALTNLASLDNVKSRIVAEKGIPCFHYLQFSDHELVRRAATEALCNLLPHPKMVDHLKVVDNLKLWAAFAQLGVEDPPTAAAALGCLAMAVRDPEVAKNFMADGVAGCEALVCALLSVEPDIPNASDLILRAAVAASYLAEEASLRPLLLLGGVADALNEALLVVRGAEGLSAARAADACEDALKLLKKELKDVQEMQAKQAEDVEPAEETLSPGEQSNLSLD
eukprot:g16275.t1